MRQAKGRISSVESHVSPVLAGKDELNIAEFPISLLCDRSPKGRNSVEFSDHIFDPQVGREISRTLTITAPEKYGLPTSTDDDVILALLQLTKLQNNFSRPEVYFTRLQLIEILCWPDKGSSYTRITQSLDRWASTYLKYQNAWWDNKERQWTSGGFHIVDSFEINDGRASNSQGELLRSHVTWGKVFFKSCQAGYLKSLNYGLYVKLAYHTSKRMYRFLDKRFYHKSDLTFELRDFAFEHIGLSRNFSSNAGKIKEKLMPAIEELEARGFLEPLPREDRFRKDGRDWLIRLVKKLTSEEPLPREELPATNPLAEELVKRGVTESTAWELVQLHPAQHIEGKIEVLDWLNAKNDKRIQRSPAGYLVESIRRNYSPPKGFESKAERQARVERSREDAKKATQEGRQRREEQRRQEEERAAVEAYLAQLGSEERAALQAEAIAAAPEDVIQGLESPGLALFLDTLRQTCLRTYVAEKVLRRDPSLS